MSRLYRKRAGFTLIELMLAMAFVGALLVAIAMATIHIMSTYTKGLTVREVNQAGRTISEDIQRTIASSTPFDITDGSDSKYIKRDGAGGRLCTGTYTYAWNYGNTSQLGGNSSTNVYNVYEDDSESHIRLVKVSDTGAALCLDPTRQITKAQAKELLLAGDRGLAVQALTVSSGTRDDISGQAIYAISLTIGTNNSRGDNWTVLNPTNTSCLPPHHEDQSGNADFCAINQFDIIARAGNRSGSL